MSSKLPIAILSPHGGQDVPAELVGRIALTPEQIFNEADAYIDELFDFRDSVLYYETFSFGRTIIDVNRPTEPSRHHRKGDGVIKTLTGYGDAVYHPGREPDAALERALIGRYWKPWHDQLARIARDERVKLVIDCHSMAAVGPSKYDDPGRLRPRIMVANLGDARGEPHPLRKRLTASAEIARFMATTLGEQMATVDPLTDVGPPFALNDPFWGGWDLQAHGLGEQPWLMIELNRGLYIGDQHATAPIVPLAKKSREALQDKLWATIVTVTQFVTAQ